MVFHDDTLEELTSGSGYIHEKRFDDLPGLDFEKAKLIHEKIKRCEKSLDSKIPLLEDLFKELPDAPIMIDIKQNDPLIPELLHELIKKYEREENTCWGSLRHESINQKLYGLNNKIPLFFSKVGILKIYVFYYLGLLPFVPIKESVLQVPMDVPGMQWSFLSSMLFYHLNARGIPALVFKLPGGAVNTKEDWELCRTSGVNGICTDDVVSLKTYFEEIVKDVKDENKASR